MVFVLPFLTQTKKWIPPLSAHHLMCWTRRNPWKLAAVSDMRAEKGIWHGANGQDLYVPDLPSGLRWGRHISLGLPELSTPRRHCKLLLAYSMLILKQEMKSNFHEISPPKQELQESKACQLWKGLLRNI